VNYAPSNPSSTAAATAKAADLAIVFVASQSSEGSDRASLSLPDGQDDLIAAIVAAQPNTIVIVHGPAPIVMPWASSVSTIVYGFYPGQEDGNSIADVLFGDINPSARLPVTFPVTQAQIPINTPAQYPGINKQANYSEGLLVGYRWYDAMNVAPLFPFGHGLSYTSFDYSNLQISGSKPIVVSVDIHNNGTIEGAEVPQLYLGFPASAGEPPKVLRRFTKVPVMAGKLLTVTFDALQDQDFSIWDVTLHDWTVVHGTFNLYVGASSKDIRLTKTIQY